MRKLGQRLQLKQTSDAKPWWVCMIATLSFCLWSLNFLPILQVEYQLITNLAISQHRLPLLQRLSGQSNFEFPRKSSAFSSLEILPEDTNPASSKNSELISVRVKIRFPLRSAMNEVERCLDELTTPTMESAECQVFANQLLKERWRLESSNHLKKRLELDQERDLNAIETEKFADDVIDVTLATTPFRLTSFGTREHRPNSHTVLLDNLRELIHTRTESVDAMTLTLEKLKAQSRGFLSLTGSPGLNPLVRPLSMLRFTILCFLSVSVWLLLMCWLYPIENYARFLKRSNSSSQQAQANNKETSTSGSTSSGVKKTTDWMLREGIPYLGTIQIHLEEPLVGTARLKSNPRLALDTNVAAEPELISTASSPPSPFDAIKLLRNLGEGSLVLWIGLFASRLFFDPAIRELISLAPLAAISRIVFGIR